MGRLVGLAVKKPVKKSSDKPKKSSKPKEGDKENDK